MSYDTHRQVLPFRIAFLLQEDIVRSPLCIPLSFGGPVFAEDEFGSSVIIAPNGRNAVFI